MYNNQCFIWLFVGISSVLVSQTTSQRWTDMSCDEGQSCPPDSTCKDIDHCECDQGYIWVNSQCRVYCGDSQSCPTYFNCTDNDYCECDQGYIWMNSECRVQCSYTNISCPSNSNCWWSNSGLYCACSSGYTWRGGLCRVYCDDDQSCPTNSTCIDNGYCECDHGYISVNSECRDFDICFSSHPCHQNALCTNAPGSYYCTCKNGYTVEGRNCTDIDECSDSNPCDRSAVCEKYPGGYNCTCHTGYSGNGTLCTDTQVVGPDALAASPGAIAGGVIGACVVLIAVVLPVFILIRRRRKEKSDAVVPKPPYEPQYETSECLQVSLPLVILLQLCPLILTAPVLNCITTTSLKSAKRCNLNKHL